MVNQSFWKNKKVFITGHTGFKGGWMSMWLYSMGAIVKGYSLEPLGKKSLYNIASIGDLINSEIGDIRDLSKLSNSIEDFSPDILIHMAAQPLVIKSYSKPVETFETNVIGTVNILEAARHSKTIKVIINITTDKCYENDGRQKGYKESDPMGGIDPYSSSKGCAELVASSYKRSFFDTLGIGIASVRAGNVIGGGDWAENRLIPDILRNFSMNQTLSIRNPSATRPWQHVLEPLSGYLMLAEKIYLDPNKYSGAYNFGPEENDVQPVEWIVKKMAQFWQGSKWVIEETSELHEAHYLKLDIDKASKIIGWTPQMRLEESLLKIYEWHMHYINNQDMQKYSINEIKIFEENIN
jgi:CDP-glucose 4,6-dehydratase